MTLSFITPVALLSIFPHQEPRFLLPIVIPLAYLQGTTILPESDFSLVEVPKVYSSNPTVKKSSYTLLKIWLLLNTILTIFYGFLHQGGVFPATSYIAHELKIAPQKTQFHIVTSHIYSLPVSFLMQPSTNKIFSKGKTHYTIARQVFLYEEGSKDMDYILDKLNNIFTKEIDISKKTRIYLLISGSLEDYLEFHVLIHDLQFQLEETFYPHISLEAFPDFSKYCLDLTKSFYSDNCIPLPLIDFIWQLLKMFRLNLYRVTLREKL